MGVEVLLLYLGVMLLLGPGTILYGLVMVVRQRATLSRGRVLYSGGAVDAGLATMLIGVLFTDFLWYMGRYFPH